MFHDHFTALHDHITILHAHITMLHMKILYDHIIISCHEIMRSRNPIKAQGHQASFPTVFTTRIPTVVTQGGRRGTVSPRRSGP